MSIGKPKNEPIDLNGLMNEIENDHRITVESDAVDKRIEELRVAQRDLRQATEALEKATMTLNEAIAALKSATDSSANIVTGINNAIVNAQENTKFKVSIAQEDVELLIIPGGDITQIDTPEVWEYLKNVHDSNGRIAAICAGVDVLEHAGLLEDAESIHSCEKDVVTSHRITTSRANGYVDFAIEVAKQMELFEDEAVSLRTQI